MLPSPGRRRGQGRPPVPASVKVVFHVGDVANDRWAWLLARSCLDDSPDATIVFVTYRSGLDSLVEDAEDRHAIASTLPGWVWSKGASGSSSVPRPPAPKGSKKMR